MSMSLDELLALLPDNSEGLIDASDLRVIVGELWARASVVGEVFGYSWQASTQPPTNGRAGLSPVWGVGSSVLLVSEVTDSGQTLVFSVLDGLPGARVVLVGTNGGVLHADVTGVSVDQGAYREVPIVVTSVEGIAPINNEKVSVVVRVVVP